MAGCSLHRRRRTETPGRCSWRAAARQSDSNTRMEQKYENNAASNLAFVCLLLSVYLSNAPCHSEGSSADKPLSPHAPPNPLKTKGCSFACGYVTSTVWAGTLYGVANSHFSLAHDSCCLGSVAIQKDNNKAFFFLHRPQCTWVTPGSDV